MQNIETGSLWYHHKDPDKHYRIEWVVLLKTYNEADELEEHVVYRALYPIDWFGDNSLWVRPKRMFLETVEINGKQIPRFSPVPTNN